MSVETISIAEARSMLLAAQGLALPPARRAEKQDVLGMIRRMRVLQIDTISVVARSPYLVLWSRLGDYAPGWLDELLAEGRLFEYWSHAMCFLPIEDYRLYRRFMLDGGKAWGGDPAGWVRDHREMAERVLGRIRDEGGLRSADFKDGRRPPGGWWKWKDEKIALECLFILGDVMIARRERFQRVYDLRERVLPGWEDGVNAAEREEAWRVFTLRAVEALGVALADWVPDYYRIPKKGNASRLEGLADEGLIRRVAIEGLPGAAYMHRAAVPGEASQVTTLLSPFDPVVWDRKRLKELFGFDYKIEVYTPAALRPFGYFTLPILHRGALVGRLDPKAQRAEGVFEVKALALEPGVRVSDELVDGLGAALRRVAAWHGTPELVIRRTEPAGLAELLVR